MRKITGLIGQNIISLADGHPLGTVKDVVISDAHDTVRALVLDEGGLLSDRRVVPLDAVSSYGRDAIVIERDDAAVDAHTMPDADVDPKRALGGMKVFSSTGDELGAIADVYFEELDGRIVGFELSAGMMSDVASGRHFLGIEDVDRVGDDIIYVRPDAAEDLDPVPEGSGGAIGALEDLTATAGDAAREAGDRLSGAGSTVAAAMDPSTGEPAAPDVVGRRSGADVIAPDGGVIVANGQIITQDHVRRAEETAQTEELRAAADAWTTAERARQIGGAVEQVADAAGSAWDRFMGKISELTDESGKRVSEQQTKARLAAINDAVGRPVTKVILDRSDEVILDLGDIITHEAVQRAYEAGILDSLLDSVYRGDVSFDRDEMKAAADGTSTVERASGGATIVDELQTSVDTAEQEREEASERERSEAGEAREQREAERQARAEAREQAADHAGPEDPQTEPGEPELMAEEDEVDADGVHPGTATAASIPKTGADAY